MLLHQILWIIEIVFACIFTLFHGFAVQNYSLPQYSDKSIIYVSARQHNLINVYLVWKIDFRVFVWEFCILFVKWKGTIHLGWMYNVIFIYIKMLWVPTQHTESVIRCIKFLYLSSRMFPFHSHEFQTQNKNRFSLSTFISIG